MQGLAQRTLQTLRQAQRAQLEKEIALNHESAQGRPDVVRAMVDAYGTGDLQPLPELKRLQPSGYDIVQPPVDPVTQQAYQDLLNPSGGANTPFIQEDPGLLTHNLFYGRKPLSVAEQLRLRQADAFAQDQWAMQQAVAAEQVKLTRAQRQALHLQQWATEQERQRLLKTQAVSEVPKTTLRAKARMDHVEASAKESGFLGERKYGAKSHLSPKSLLYRDDTDLALKLYEHFVSGQGQPVEIGLEKLDFSKHVSLRQQLPSTVRLLMLRLPAKNSEAFLRKMLGNHSVKVTDHNGRIAMVEIKDSAMPIDLNIAPLSDPAKFAAFGRITLNVLSLDIYINHQNQTVTVEGELGSSDSERQLDTFNFDPSNREWYKEALTSLVREGAPPGSTSFKIFARARSHSGFRRQYTFKEFLE